MKNFLLSLLTIATATLVSAIVPPGASTPEFYLVASSQSSSVNLLPVRTTGGAGGYSTLSGSAPIAIYYFYQGTLTSPATAGNPPSATQRAVMGHILGSVGCSSYAQLGLVQGSSSNKCARYNPFGIQSNNENSQLGAKLVYDNQGAFYACGSGNDIWYKVNPSDGPAGLSCTPIDLYTVPVV